ncbi:MAG: hypothetical protein AYK22_07780 [Thermoplasmatales archaeon SG8-52-3]|nr:MAG: hypothetical protein AYK22_07780 [Thermoplasmatales archaeon SG8-52-3]
MKNLIKTELVRYNKEMINNNKIQKIRVAILAEEPMGWGSGKHYFKTILDGYSWEKESKTYIFSTKYIFDKDILKGKLNNSDFDVLLIPGGGVGDGQSIMKGFTFLPKVRNWKKNIQSFIKNGGGCVGICGGAALITGLKTRLNQKPHTFLEKQYDKSSLNVSCVNSFYKTLAFPLFYPFQKKHPEKIGATAYVFSFSPGKTVDKVGIHTGGVPIDFEICKDNPIFSDLSQNQHRIRWWGGSALILPKNPDRDVKVLAKYPAQDLSENKLYKIFAWTYTGGIHGLFFAFLKSLKLIKKEKESLKNVFLYSYYLAGNWKISDKIIDLDYSNKASITSEIYPNENAARIILCTSHPEYLVWWGGSIEENINIKFNCLGNGLHRWKDINKLSNNLKNELTHTWWMVRRFTAWTAKVPDTHLPPIHQNEITEKEKIIIKNNIFWDGSFINKIKNI